MTEFTPWPKIPRLRREMIVTEKIDGTNSCIIVQEVDPDEIVASRNAIATATIVVDEEHPRLASVDIYAQSRKRFITPTSDNFGFAEWVQIYADVLAQKLGIGRHFGEWWGLGIQRGYDMQERRFSLFNIKRWDRLKLAEVGLNEIGVDVVPTLNSFSQPDDGYPVFDTNVVEMEVDWLREHGSVAAPGFKDPEGVVVRHMASGQMFKRLLENDEVPKGVDTGEIGELVTA